MKPWVCPKCKRVWGPLVSQCVPCNHAVSQQNVYPGLHRPPAVTR